MNLDVSKYVSIISAFAAIVSASVAIWQAYEARAASEVTYKMALATQRLESCIKMNNIISQASLEASYRDVVETPYRDNQRFLSVLYLIHTLGEETVNFKQMTPGETASNFNDSVWTTRIDLKDMLLDGSYPLTRRELRKRIRSLRSEQLSICNEMLGPEGGY